MIDKPAGLVVHPAPGHRGETLVDVLGDLLGGGEAERPGIVHRLDKETSGLMIVARDEEAHRRLSKLIAAREVERHYLALADGVPRSRSGTIDAPLGRDRRAPERRAVGGRGARDAVTHFEVVEALAAARRCSTSGSRPGARTRSAPTSPRSATRSPATRATAAAPDSASGASSCTAPGSGSSIRSRGERLEFESPLPADLAAALELARQA